jgi:hypothetical protein
MDVNAFGLAAGMKPCAGRRFHIVFLARNMKPRKSNDWFGKSPRRFASLHGRIREELAAAVNRYHQSVPRPDPPGRKSGPGLEHTHRMTAARMPNSTTYQKN